MALLGIMIALLSGVFMTVLNILIASTVPVAPPASTKCPHSKGRKIISMIPAAKFDSEPCNANPIARPAAPIMATNDVVSTPSVLNEARITTTSNFTAKRADFIHMSFPHSGVHHRRSAGPSGPRRILVFSYWQMKDMPDHLILT